MIYVYNPEVPGVVWGTTTKNGKSNNIQLENVISQIQRGKGSKRALKIICCTDKGFLNKKNTFTLGELFAPKKAKNKSYHKRNTSGLNPITAANRQKAIDKNTKVDFLKEAQSIRERVLDGESISSIARSYKVTTSAFSMANKRFNLYPKQSNIRGKEIHEIQNPKY